MTKIFDVLPGFVYAIVVAILLGLLGLQTVRISGLKGEVSDATTKLAAAKIKSAEFKKQVATLTKEASEKAREFELKLTQGSKENAREIANETTSVAALGNTAVAAQPRLREYITKYIETPGPARAPTESSCAGFIAAEKARTIGLLLESCNATTISDGKELEGLATQVRGLQRHNENIEKAYEAYSKEVVETKPDDSAK